MSENSKKLLFIVNVDTFLISHRLEIALEAINEGFEVHFAAKDTGKMKEIQDLITQFPFAQLGCFGFSYEKETRSAKLPDQVDAQVINDRIDAVMKTQYTSLQKQYQGLIGKTVPMLYEGNGVARAAHQAPETDTITLISNPENLRIGEFYSIKITGSDAYDLLGIVKS